MPAIAWDPLIAKVFSAEAYTRSLYHPAGSWIAVVQTTPLSTGMASLIYPSRNEAYVIEAELYNLGGKNAADKSLAKRYFIVPTSNPSKLPEDYFTAWSEDDYAYVVHERVKKLSSVKSDKGWAFDHFNFDYGIEEKDDTEGSNLSEGETGHTENSETTDTNGHVQKNVVEAGKTDCTKSQVITDEAKAAESEDIAIVQSWIANTAGRSWADIDEEDQEEDFVAGSQAISVVEDDLTSELSEVSDDGVVCIARPNTPTPYDQEDDLTSDLYENSGMNEVCFTRPSTPTLYDQDEEEITIVSPPTTPSPRLATLAEEEEIEENSDEADVCVGTTDTYDAFEEDFWKEIWASPKGEANPAGQLYYENYQEPSGDYYALSFACYPQRFKSTTSPATSLWAVSSSNVNHRLHGQDAPFEDKLLGVPFSRQSILAAQACKTINPVRYDGPGHIFENLYGSELQDAIIGYAHNTFLPVGRHVEEPYDPENPRDLHMPTDSHWSILTMPRTYLTPPYIYDHRNPDHDIPSCLEGGTGKSKKRAPPKKGSGLCHVEMCYESKEADVVIVKQETEITATTNKADEIDITNITTTTSPVSSLQDEVDHAAPELISWYTPVSQDVYEMDVIKQHEEETLPVTEVSAIPQPELKIESTATSLPPALLQQLKAELKQELKEELKEELKAELMTELLAELKCKSKAKVLPVPKQEILPEPAVDSNEYNTAITTHSPPSFFGESFVGAVTWTAAGTALLAVGVVAAIFKAVKK